jgi:hypothetical protein
MVFKPSPLVTVGAALVLAGMLSGCGSAGRSPAATASRPYRSSPDGPGSSLPVVSARTPFTAIRWIRVPGGASQAVTGDGALFTASSAGATSSGSSRLISRVDLTTGQARPAVRIGGESGMAFGGGLLWVGRDSQPTSADMTVLALDPATLAVRHTVPLGQPPSFDSEQIAYAGGLVWVTAQRMLLAIEPATARVVAQVPIPEANALDYIQVAASTDGSALWTTEDSAGGGPIAVQQRNPRTGAVLAAANGPAVGLGGVHIAAIGTTAWLAYATGMLGSYFRAISKAGRLIEIRPPSGSGGFTNSVRVYVVGPQLWIADAMTDTIACASVATGRILSMIRGSGLLPGDIEPAASGRLALLLGGDILIARPKPVCGT